MRLPWLLALAVLGSASVASAQVVMSGQWRSGATAIDVQVESWGSDCGPPPASSQSPGGSIVRIVQVGEQLQLHTGGRIIKSDVCFGQNPGLKRSSKVVKDNTWITRCETPMDDPRAETGVYTLKLLAPERLLYQDVSRFRWQLKESLCVATISTVQTLTRLSDTEAAQAAKPGAPSAPAQPVATKAATEKPGAKTPPAPPTPPKLPDLPPSVATTPAAAPTPVRTDMNMAPTLPASSAQNAAKPAACVPGPAARLALAPRRRTIELGNKLCFRTRVVDKAGCALPPATPTWALDHGPALRAKLDARGCFEASAQAADGEGAFNVAATVTTAEGSTLRAEAVLTVVAADLSGLVAKRLFDQPDGGDLEAELAADITSNATGEPEAPAVTSRTATRAVGAAEAPVSRPPWVWPAIGAVLAILGGAIALVARRRTRVSLMPEPAGLAEDPTTSKTLVQAPPKAAAPTQLRCPKCGAVYPPGSAFCGTDGSPLKA